MRKLALTPLLAALLITLPIVNAQLSNLAVIPDNWDLTLHIPYVYFDEENEHSTGNGSIAISYPGADRQCWGPVYAVEPGDNVTAWCWMKIEPLPEGYTPEPEFSGARIGFDLRYNASSEVYYCLDTLEAPTYPDTTEGIIANAVHCGDTGWNLRAITFTIPSSSYAWDWYTNTPVSPPRQINQLSMWMHMWSTLYGDNWNVTGWFADAELYINPPDYPEPTAAPYVPPSTSLGEGSGFDSLIGLCAVLAVFAIIIWPFVEDYKRRR